MTFMVSDCIKRSSDHKDTELFQDTFLLGMVRQITTNNVNVITVKDMVDCTRFQTIVEKHLNVWLTNQRENSSSGSDGKLTKFISLLFSCNNNNNNIIIISIIIKTHWEHRLGLESMRPPDNGFVVQTQLRSRGAMFWDQTLNILNIKLYFLLQNRKDKTG